MQEEQKVIDSLTDKGIELPFKKNSLIYRLGLRRIYEPYHGTLDLLADVFLKMQAIDEGSDLDQDGIYWSNALIKANNRLMIKAISIALLNGNIKIFLFGRLLRLYLSKNLKPGHSLFLVTRIREVMNVRAFTTSTRLLTGVKRTTQKPDLVENQFKQA